MNLAATRAPFHASRQALTLAVVACLLWAGAATAQDESSPENESESEIAYTVGPTTGAIGDLATIDVGEDFIFFGREATSNS